MHRYMQANCRMLPNSLAAIHQALSPIRMAEYRHLAPGGDAEQALRLYLWNARICEALLFPMQVLEVTARNAVSEAATSQRGPRWTTHRDIVANLDPYWDAQLRKVRGRIARSGHSVTTDRIVAGITFGFWCHLLTVRFVPVLWPRGIHGHFPYAPPTATYSTLQAELDRLSDYRNRIAHHKSMYDKNPAQLLTDVVTFIGYKSPDAAAYVEATCHLEGVLDSPPDITDLV